MLLLLKNADKNVIILSTSHREEPANPFVLTESVAETASRKSLKSEDNAGRSAKSQVFKNAASDATAWMEMLRKRIARSTAKEFTSFHGARKSATIAKISRIKKSKVNVTQIVETWARIHLPLPKILNSSRRNMKN